MDQDWIDPKTAKPGVYEAEMIDERGQPDRAELSKTGFGWFYQLPDREVPDSVRVVRVRRVADLPPY